MTIHQLKQAAENFFVEPYEFTVIGNSTGYSGSQMAQVIDAQGQIWCVRLWVDESIETLRFMHRVLQHSVAQGVCGLPHLVQNETGDSLIAIDNCWAEAQSWIPGAPLHKLTKASSVERTPNTGYAATADERRQIATSLAAFHASTTNLPILGTPPPALAASWETPTAYVATALMENENARTRKLRLTSEKEALIYMWQTQLLQLAEALESQVTKTFTGSTTVVVCHGDLWPDHTYFQDAQFSGF
ncbi:MAG: phosphotransferase, partial [Caldilineaceae bacterium]|nr:phosphotransferase [Caldilineaceae bacterium]